MQQLFVKMSLILVSEHTKPHVICLSLPILVCEWQGIFQELYRWLWLFAELLNKSRKHASASFFSKILYMCWPLALVMQNCYMKLTSIATHALSTDFERKKKVKETNTTQFMHHTRLFKILPLVQILGVVVSFTKIIKARYKYNAIFNEETNKIIHKRRFLSLQASTLG